MWYCNKKYERPVEDVNIRLGLLKGDLDDDVAKITLIDFLRRNIGFTVELLTGISLYPDQIIVLKGLLNRNYCLNVWGRGVGKTFIGALYCVLQTLFEPNTNILIAGPTFRTSRFIFNHIEKIASSKGGRMLFDAIGKPIKRPDEYRWSINEGSIVAIPLNGEKIRGFRANVLLIDEFLLMGEEMVEKILMPYLVAPGGIGDRKKIREQETRLIKKGLMKEDEREEFKNQSKLIALSSASYTCEYLYKKYEEFCKHIYSDDKSVHGATFFVSQFAWDSINPDRIDKSIIELAQSNESNSANFRREYGAEFIDGSDSYFSMKKMIECTIPDGESPSMLLRGSKDGKYILSFDTNASNSTRGDDFAMTIIELDADFKGGTVVHSYAEAGRDLKDHIKYFYYLMTNFNVVMICGDHAGHHQFIDSANESEHFKRVGMELKIMDFEPCKDGEELQEELKKGRREYNTQAGRIIFTQLFREESIRRMNEQLQGCIDFKKIWFGSSIKGDGATFERAAGAGVDVKFLDYENVMELIDEQDILVRQTKYQCAAIELKTSSRGAQTFDLPQIFKRDTTSTRLRKDSYTSLMLGCWGMKQYHDIMNLPAESVDVSFVPFYVR